jgi:hypothetical protein
MKKWYLSRRECVPRGLLKKYAWYHGAQILYILRSGYADDWDSLCNFLDLPMGFTTNAHGALYHTLEALREAQFIQFTPGRWTVEGKITSTGKWESVQTSLRVNLSELAMLTEEAVVANPIFDFPEEPERQFDIFVLMPFDAKIKAVYSDHITKVAKRLDLTLGRADDLFASSAIVSDIWSSLFVAKVIIADCTGKNPNVFYELGIAHTLGKSVILITQDAADVPFDVKYLRYVEYSYTPPGMLAFEERLGEAIKIELARYWGTAKELKLTEEAQLD